MENGPNMRCEMDYTETMLESREIYSGRIIRVHVDEVELSDGTRSRREIVDHHGGVAVLPVDAEGYAYCVRQYRYAYGKSLLEAPAGKLEPGERPEDCALRELSEETGFTAGRLVPLGWLYPSPGYCSEVLYLFLATGLKPGRAHLDPGEFLDVERHSLAELEEMVLRDELHDAKTVTAVWRARRFLAGEEAQGCQAQC